MYSCLQYHGELHTLTRINPMHTLVQPEPKCDEVDELCQHLGGLDLESELQEIVEMDLDTLALHYLMTHGEYHYLPPDATFDQLNFNKLLGHHAPKRQMDWIKKYLLTDRRGYQMLQEKVDQLLKNLHRHAEIEKIEEYINNMPWPKRWFAWRRLLGPMRLNFKPILLIP